MTSDYNSFSFTLTNGLGHLVLNRPPGNPMTTGFFSELNLVVDELRTMKGLKSIVISSSGRHFSSGADLDGLIGLFSDISENDTGSAGRKNAEFLEKNYRSFLFFEDAGIPVVSAIRGVCIGSAFELALFSHFRFCGEDAVFGLPETTFNLIPGIGGIPRMEALCGTAKTIELVMKGKTFGAEEAVRYNLVHGILPKRKVVDYALAFAGRIADGFRKEKMPLYIQKIQADGLRNN
jgi:enoyl-CoA hydratase